MGIVVYIVIFIGVIFGMKTYLKSSKKKDEERGIPKEKAALIRRNFLISFIIGVILIIMGISSLGDSKVGFNAEVGTRTYKASQEDNKWGTICLVAGIGLCIFAVIYNNNAKIKELKSDTKNEEKSNNTQFTVADKMEELKRMLDSNIITKEEFEKKKKEIIDKM